MTATKPTAREQALETALRNLVDAIDGSEVFDDDDKVDRAVKRASELLPKKRGGR